MNHKIKTLIVEDDMVSRMILENYCTNHPDIELLKDFDNAEDARLFLQTNAVDLVLLDIQLKNSSGFDLLKDISENTHVIVTTGDPQSIAEARERGIKACLLKPIGLQEFLWEIKKIKPITEEII